METNHKKPDKNWTRKEFAENGWEPIPVGDRVGPNDYYVNHSNHQSLYQSVVVENRLGYYWRRCKPKYDIDKLSPLPISSMKPSKKPEKRIIKRQTVGVDNDW